MVADNIEKFGNRQQIIKDREVVSTEVTTRADILPCDSVGKWNVLGKGKTNSNTQAQKGPATVLTIGNHTFVLSRQMSYVGPLVSLDPATICVNANNYNMGVQTTFDRIPVLRMVARSVAYGEAERTRPQAERIAAGKISRAGLPEFQSISGERFEAVNEMLARGAEKRLDLYGRAPEYSSHSSSTHLFIESQTALTNSLGGAAPPIYPLPDATLTVHVHESLVNTVIDGVGIFAEQKVNELLKELSVDALAEREQLLNRLRERLSGDRFKEDLRLILPFADQDLLEAVAELIPDLALSGLGQLQQLEDAHGIQLDAILQLLGRVGLPELRFADCDPIRVRFDEGAIVLVFSPQPRQESVKTGVLKLNLKVVDGKVGLRLPETVSDEFKPFEERLRLLVDKLQERLRNRLKAKLEARLPSEIVTLPEHLDFEFKNAQLSDGWLTLEVGATIKPTEPTTN